MSPLNMEVSGVRGSGVYSRRNREPPKLTHYANKVHICTKCKKEITKGEEYFCEDRFLESLNKNQTKLCKECYQK
jgi:hypothetical protein